MQRLQEIRVLLDVSITKEAKLRLSFWKTEIYDTVVSAPFSMSEIKNTTKRNFLIHSLNYFVFALNKVKRTILELFEKYNPTRVLVKFLYRNTQMNQ